MSGYTKGPWFYGQTPNQRDNHPGQRSVGLGPEEDGSIFGYRLNSDNEDGAYMNLSGYCTEADARLIAAAPDLLDALRVVDTCCEMDDQVRRIVSTAIAKALGQ